MAAGHTLRREKKITLGRAAGREFVVRGPTATPTPCGSTSRATGFYTLTVTGAPGIENQPDARRFFDSFALVSRKRLRRFFFRRRLLSHLLHCFFLAADFLFGGCLLFGSRRVLPRPASSLQPAAVPSPWRSRPIAPWQRAWPRPWKGSGSAAARTLQGLAAIAPREEQQPPVVL